MTLHDELAAESNPLFLKKFYSGQYERRGSFTPSPTAAQA